MKEIEKANAAKKKKEEKKRKRRDTLGMDFTLMFFKFGSSTFGLVKLVGWI